MIYSSTFPYPQNLVSDVIQYWLVRHAHCDAIDAILDRGLNADQLRGVEYVLSLLTEERRALILARYRDGKASADIAAELHNGERRIINIWSCYRDGKASVKIATELIDQVVSVNQNVASTLVRLSRDFYFKYILYGYEGAKARDFESTDVLPQISDDAMKQMSVSELLISVRTYNALVRYGHIKTICDLCDRTENELLQIHNFGNKSLEDVQSALALYGLSLRSS